MKEISGGQKLAHKVLNLRLKLGRWMASNYDCNFNKNGKSNSPLTSRQYDILVAVNEWNLHTISDLNKLIILSKSSLSITLNKMVEEGYLTREQAADEDDKRKVYFNITEKGINAYKGLDKIIIAAIEGYYNKLTDKQKKEVEACVESANNIFNEIE